MTHSIIQTSLIMATFTSKSTLPGWEDVTPVPQDDGDNPVVSISYAAAFRELMDLFRAVLQSGEKSERVLELTEEILDINAANYTVWQYRRETLFSLNYDLNIEMDYMDTFAEENPKNYQIWFHRRVVVERLGDSSRELPFTASVFLVDAKNYHAWSHRQWVLTAFSLWEENELEFVDAMLEMDIRNNSAWNYRWFFLHGTDACAARPVTEDRVESEIAFTFRAIEKVKLNESAWNYLTGLRKKYRDVMPVVTSLSIDDRLASMLERFDVENVKCYFLWEALADIAIHCAGTECKIISCMCTDREEQQTAESLQRAGELFRRLGTEDRMRTCYWSRKAEECLARAEGGEGQTQRGVGS